MVDTVPFLFYYAYVVIIISMANEGGYRSRQVDDTAKGVLDLLRRQFGKDSLKATLDELEEAEEAARVSVRSDLALSAKPAEGVERFEAQHAKALAALTAFGIETKKAPSWERIKEAITPEQLRSVEHMQQPKLVLIPPMTRQQMVGAINGQKGKYGIRSDTYTYNLDDDALYNDGKPEGTPTWEVSIVEGVTDVGVNEALQMKGGNFRQNHEQVSALLKDLKGKGLEALSGARNHLAAMIGALADGQPIDVQNWTVLNANTVDKNPKSLLGGGYWYVDQVGLDFDLPNVQGSYLRLRGAVRVNL